MENNFKLLNTATINLVKSFEGLHDGNLSQIGLQPKMDPIGIWTEGYGLAMINPHTGKHLAGINNKANALKWQTIRTEQEAVIALGLDLVRYSKYAAKALGIDIWAKLTPNQKGALTSFVYNCGIGSPPYKIFNNINMFTKGKLSKAELLKYWQKSVIRGGGKVLPGLVRRRAAEASLFFTP